MIKLPAFASTGIACLALCFGLLARANEAGTQAAIPSFTQLEAQGARIGTIHVRPDNIFDLNDARENGALFQLANALHVRTREDVIRETLLFKPGDRVSARLIEETERLFRTKRYIYDVDIRPTAYVEGIVDIEVVTRDTWSLDLTGKVSRSGGVNSTAFGLKDENFLGTGTVFGVEQVSDPDRSGWRFELSYPRAFDGWTQLLYEQGHFSDGSLKRASILRPFYALDTRWAAGASAMDEDRIDSIYNGGDVVSKFRHRVKSGDAFGGWSRGLIDRYSQRYSVGVTAQDDGYSLVPDETAPQPFPVDHKVRGPFVRYEIVEDRFLKTRNRTQIARPEFVSLGLNIQVQVTKPLESWGATQSSWLYDATLADGFVFPWGHDLHVILKADRRVDSTGGVLGHQGALVRYFGPQNRHSAFYGSIAVDRIGTAAAADQLQLGGDTGLRGYPQRYQEGERRVLLTLEERVYTDWYLFRLVRVGGAAFCDVGRAWGGVNQNVVNPGWLSDVGVGLRLALDRAAFANVLHADIAVPLDRAAGIKSVQYLLKTQLTF